MTAALVVALRLLPANRFPFLMGGGLVWGVCLLLGIDRAMRRGVDAVSCGLFAAGYGAFLLGLFSNSF